MDISGTVTKTWMGGKTPNFTVNTTGKYNTYPVFDGVPPKEGDKVTFAAEIFRIDGDYTRWKIIKGTFKVDDAPSESQQPQHEGGEKRAYSKRDPDAQNRSFALAYAKDITVALRSANTDGWREQVALDTIFIAKYFEEYLYNGTLHEKLKQYHDERRTA